MTSDADLAALMDRAIALGERGDNRVLPNPRVGALYWREGKILGVGWHRQCGDDHAEVAAARAAGMDVAGSTLVVSLEPCSHHGRTPPCVDFLLKHRVHRVIYALADPNPSVAGAAALAAGSVAVQQLYRPGALALVEPFAKNLQQRAYLTLKWAMSLDGKIAARGGDARWISGEESRQYAHILRARADGVLVGAGTVLADLPDLGLRHGVEGNPPRPIVWDPRARTAALAAWWAGKLARRPLALTHPDKLAGWPAGVETLGIESIADLDARLFSAGLRHVLVEGGSRLHGALLDAGLADAVHAFIAPRILGGATAPGPVAGAGVDRAAAALPLLEARTESHGADLSLHGLLRVHLPGGATLLGTQNGFPQ